MITLRVRYCYVQSLTSLVSPEITRHDHSIIARSGHIHNGVILHAHPVRGESHNQRNTTGEGDIFKNTPPETSLKTLKVGKKNLATQKLSKNKLVSPTASVVLRLLLWASLKPRHLHIAFAVGEPFESGVLTHYNCYLGPFASRALTHCSCF